MAVAEARKDDGFAALTLGNIGLALERLGELSRALEAYTRAAKLLHDLGMRAEEAGTRAAIGHLQARRGEFRAARETLEAALALQTETGDTGASQTPPFWSARVQKSSNSPPWPKRRRFAGRPAR